MQITNVYDLPQQLVDMATVDYRVAPNEYRATSLLKGIRETILTRRHDADIIVDVSDMIWALFGTAVHDVLKRSEEASSELKEERIIQTFGDYLLSGQFDLYCGESYVLSDYKTTSVWKIVYKNFDDWFRQGCIYAALLESLGFPVTEFRVVAFLKDHSKSKARRDWNYPQLPVYRHYFEITDKDIADTKDWIQDRFRQIKEAENLPDNELPICTNDERWYSGDKWAVMKKGRKSAVRVLDTEKAATHYLETEMDAKGKPKGEYIEIRPGENRKCDEYCYAAPFCNWYQDQKTKPQEEQNDSNSSE